MKRALITGGSGFIGQELTIQLFGLGWAVRVLDTERPQFASEWIKGDVRTDTMAAATDCEAIWHLASKVGVRYYVDDPAKTADIVLRGTTAVLDAAHAHGNIPVFMLSTSEAYGNATQFPTPETADGVFGNEARWSYGMAKRIADAIALQRHDEEGMPLRIVRPFNVVGEGQASHGGLVFPAFARGAKHGTIRVHGDGTQTRTFCHVWTLVQGMIRLSETPEANGEVVNLGTDEEVTIAELAYWFMREAEDNGWSPKIVFQPYDEAYPGGQFADVQRRVPDLTKANRLIGWETMKRPTICEMIREAIGA